MKVLPLIVVCLLVAACSTPPAEPNIGGLRPEVLYFMNSEGGRKAAREVVELYAGRQEVAVVDHSLPAVVPPVPAARRALPVYPAELVAQRVDGEVTIGFIVDEQGSVFDAVVVETSHAGLNSAALAAVRSWKFTPAKRGGVPVRCQLQVPLFFKHGG